MEWRNRDEKGAYMAIGGIWPNHLGRRADAKPTRGRSSARLCASRILATGLGARGEARANRWVQATSALGAPRDTRHT